MGDISYADQIYIICGASKGIITLNLDYKKENHYIRIGILCSVLLVFILGRAYA